MAIDYFAKEVLGQKEEKEKDYWAEEIAFVEAAPVEEAKDYWAEEIISTQVAPEVAQMQETFDAPPVLPDIGIAETATSIQGQYRPPEMPGYQPELDSVEKRVIPQREAILMSPEEREAEYGTISIPEPDTFMTKVQKKAQNFPGLISQQLMGIKAAGEDLLGLEKTAKQTFRDIDNLRFDYKDIYATGPIDQFLWDAVDVATQLPIQMVASFYGPAGIGTVLGTQGYTEARMGGADKPTSAAKGVISGALQYFLQRYLKPVENMMKGKFGSFLASEPIEEFSQSVIETSVIDRLVLDRDTVIVEGEEVPIDSWEGFKHIVKQGLYAASLSVAAGGPVAKIMSSVNRGERPREQDFLDAAFEMKQRIESGLSEAETVSELTALAKTPTPDSRPEYTPAETDVLHKTAARLIKTRAEPDLEKKPIAYHEVKSRAPLREAIATYNDTEVEFVFRDKATPGDDKVMAGIELYKRKAAAKQNTDGVLDEIFDIGLDAGRIVSAFNEMKGTIPEYAVLAFERKLKKQGLMLRPEDKERLMKASNEHKDAIALEQKAAKAFRDDIHNIELRNIYDKAKNYREMVTKRFQYETSILDPTTTSETLGRILQGNLLIPISHGRNVIGNFIFMPPRATSQFFASLLQRVPGAKKYFGKDIPIDVGQSAPRSALNLAKGLATATKEAVTDIGPISENIAGENIKNLRPFQAMYQAMTGKEMAIDVITGKPRTGHRVAKMVEAMPFAWNAELMFRVLYMGDKPFKVATADRVARGQAKLKGLRGDELEAFIRFPDKRTADLIDKTVAESVFQQQSAIGDSLQNALRSDKFPEIMQPYIDFTGKVVIPYRQTPVNYLKETADYTVPFFSMAQMGHHLREAAIARDRLTDPKLNPYQRDALQDKEAKSKREAAIYFGKTGTSLIMGTVAGELVRLGLTSPPYDKEQKNAKKILQLSYDGPMGGPNRFNMDGFKRWAQGLADNKSPEELEQLTKPKPGDKTIKSDALGVFGVILGVKSKIKSRTDSGKIIAEENRMMNTIKNELMSMQGVWSAIFEQSFAKGFNTLLTGISKEDYSLAVKLFDTMSAIPLPGNLSAVMRTQREYMPDTRSNNWQQEIENIIQSKVSWSEASVARRGMFGQKILQTPEGSNPYVYQLFDLFKTVKGGTNKLGMELYQLFHRTRAPEVVPTPPQRTFTVPFKMPGEKAEIIKLSDKQLESLQEDVGTQRLARMKAKNIIDKNGDPTEIFKSQSDENKILLLKSAYGIGGRLGRMKFYADNRKEFQAK